MSEKTRYTDEELQEFKELILKKLDKAQKDYELLKANVMNSDGNDTADTSPTFKVLEEGASTLGKEEAGQLAQRQMKFIQHVQAALIRIENKTYGTQGAPYGSAPCYSQRRGQGVGPQTLIYTYCLRTGTFQAVAGTGFYLIVFCI